MMKLYTTFCLACCLMALPGCSDAPGTNNSGKTNDLATVDTDATNTTLSPAATIRDFTYSFTPEEKRFSFPAHRGDSILLPSGTQILVPANCFVTKAGKPVTGNVQLAFEEFLTAGSIIRSGINMTYDSAGLTYPFESAGMFRINAFQGQEALMIAANKSIEVALASPDSDRGFNAYYSTRDGSDWTYLRSSDARPNRTRAENLENLKTQISQAIKPQKPLEYSADGKYFDLNLSRAHTQDLKSLLGVVWEYSGKDKQSDPAQNKKAFNRNWDFVSILPKNDRRGEYEILLQNKDTTVKTVARPVFRGVVLDAQNEEFKKELGEFNQRMARMYNEQKQAIAEASFIRTLSVKNLGLYNYDRQYHQSNMIPVLADFDFGADSLKSYPINVYLVTGNGLAVIQYPIGDWKKFRYSKLQMNKMIAILPNQEICTFSARRFKEEAPVFLEDKPGPYTFVLKHTGVKASDSKSIDRVLSSI